MDLISQVRLLGQVGRLLDTGMEMTIHFSLALLVLMIVSICVVVTVIVVAFLAFTLGRNALRSD